MWNPRQQDQERTERLRGWIVYLLYMSRPKALELASLTRLLDRRNLPVSRRRLAEEIDYLRSLRLIRVFNIDAEEELTEVQQAKLVQKYSDCDSDEEMGTVLCARITTAGINFQQGIEAQTGLARVE